MGGNARIARARALAMWLATMLLVLALGAGAAHAASEVTTAGYNNLRDSWDASEPALAPSAVSSSSFGQLFATQLDGAVYAQPLLFGNTLIATTEKANAYGLDPATGAIRWSRSFGQPFKSSTIGCSDLKPYLGSTSTPVIDPETGTVYLTTRLQLGKGIANSHWYLQALSATTGEERKGFPVEIAGTPYNTPEVPFNEGYAMQRPGLLLMGGVVYLGFASNCDISPYRGIVVGVDENSGSITSMWSAESGVGTDENSLAGIWQSGGGLVSDLPGRIILASGNGVSPVPAPSNSPPATLSESVIGLRIGGGGQIAPSQFFAPSDAPTLDQNDEDLGSGGPLALPTEYFGVAGHPHLVVEDGKDGRVFLIDADNMGGYRQGAGEGDAVLQTLGPFNGVWGHPAAYGGQGGWVYVLESAGGGFLRALSYGLNGKGVPQLASAATSAESFGYTSGSPIVTSNGTSTGSAVVWVVYTKGANGGGSQLRAYEAIPTEGTLHLLWSGKIGKASKFSTPTAAEGRVYVGTRKGQLIAFGSGGAAAVAAPAAELGSVEVGARRSVTLPVTISKSLALTAPVSAEGVETLPGPLSAHSAAAGRSSGGASSGKQTAGPRTPPPSGTTSLAGGVITVQQPAQGRAIPAGATLPLRITFAPAHAGPVTANLTLHTSAGVRTISVSGYGTKPGLLLSARPLDFGTIQTRAGGKRLSMTFANSWTGVERITSVSLPRGPYTASGLPAPGTALAPRHAVTVSVLFDPTRAGSYPATLRVATNHGSVSVHVSGSALTGRPRLVVATRHLDIGAVPVGHTKALTLDVGNTGTVPLTITRAIAPGEPFSAPTPLPEGISLDRGALVHVRVAFRPSGRGPARGRYLINSTDGRGPLTVTVTGRGV